MAFQPEGMTRVLHSSFGHPVLRKYQEKNVNITPDNLMYPLFIIDSAENHEEIPSMPEVKRFTATAVVEFLKPLVEKGLSSVLLYGVIDSSLKNERASAACTPKNPVLYAIKLLKKNFPNLLIACDVCLCAFTSHGHCGLLNSSGHIDFHATILLLAELALKYAKAGCHVVAPSDMTDRALFIKGTLVNLGYSDVSVLNYSAEFASKFDGPFRDAAGSAPSFGDRMNYQIPPGSRGLALRSAAKDVVEDIDMIMVKPAMTYLDIVRDLKEKHPEYPLFVYQVSGEYSMLYRAAEAGVFDLKDAVMESLTSMRRAGADVIITYFVPKLLLEWLKN